MNTEAMRVTRRSVVERGLVGTLFHPASDEPHPTVITLGGSDGGLTEGTAARLAERGFAALALGYFGVASLPSELMEVPLEYFANALSWLRTQPVVDAERIGVMGASKGAELALLLGAIYAEDIRTVVGYSPSAIVWQGFSYDPQSFLKGTRSSWKLKGEPVPFARLPLPRPTDFFETKTFSWPAWPFPVLWPSFRYPAARVTYERALRSETDLASKAIAVENINGPVLLVSGTEDRIWPATRFSEMIVQRLKDYGHRFNYEHLRYEGAGHSTSLPYSVSVTAQEGPFISGGSLGGSIEANGFMHADSWPKVVDFLIEALDSGRCALGIGSTTIWHGFW